MTWLPPLELAGAKAVVTGAAGGMGEHIARGLARRGAHVVAADVRADLLEDVCETIRQESPGVEVVSYAVDLSDVAATDDFIDWIRVEHSDIRILINNAGVALGGRVTEVSREDIDWLLTVNLLTPVRTTHALLPLLLDNGAAHGGHAHIVTMSSLFGLVGPPGQAAYSTSKFGLRGFSEVLRHELADERAPCGITQVHPGGIRTDIANHARVGAGTDPDEEREGREQFQKLLRFPADKAAELIIKAMIERNPRLLIGADAKALAGISRVLPKRYWSLMGRVANLGAPRGQS
ncbi:MAG: SDR family NAD(P)-dependent oxidoreductase [Actinomycetia bacterium]|nr:SDR family NAD(P)-dependent oxidoreductase [Actinomycetes bacterium]